MAAKYAVIDVETVPDMTELAYEESLLKAPATWKDPEKIARNLEEQRVSLRERMALKDSAKLSCIGVKTDFGMFEFTTFHVGSEIADLGINCYPAESEADMLRLFELWLGMFCDRCTRLVTFNGWGFDLPKIRLGFARSGIGRIATIDNPAVDLMHHFIKYYSTDKRPFVSLAEVVRRLGIADGKVIGEFYPDMIEAGEYHKAVLYNVFDCLLEEQVFFKIG